MARLMVSVSKEAKSKNRLLSSLISDETCLLPEGGALSRSAKLGLQSKDIGDGSKMASVKQKKETWVDTT